MGSDPTWYEALPDWAQDVIDQLGHVAIGGLPASLVGGISQIWLDGGWAGLIGGAVGAVTMGIYELVQNVGDQVNDYADMALDLAVGIGSAVLVGLIIWGVA